MEKSERSKKAAETRRLRAESNERIRKAQEETRKVVASGVCPECGSGIVRNLSLTGWYQCAQYGAVGFRKDANKPACSWQGFTE